MIAIFVGIIIGLVLGLTGAGGSVFAVPLLLILLNLSPQEAISLSLSAVCASALYGTITHLKGKQIQWVPAGVFAIAGSLLTPVGVWLNTLLPPLVVILSFCVLVLVVARRLWRQATQDPNTSTTVRASMNDNDIDPIPQCRYGQPGQRSKKCIWGLMGGAALTGVLSGLYGVGGGFIIVPTVMFLAGLAFKQAVATSLAIITTISLAAFTNYALQGLLPDATLTGQVVLGGIIGMTLGIFSSKRLAGPTLQKFFSLMMALMAIVTVIKFVTNT